jgi:predicted kinase
MTDQTPKIYVLIGPPASGKSTWTKNFLSSNPDYVVISSDDIIEKHAAANGLNYTQAFDKFSGFAISEMKKEATNAFAEKRNIIWDQTNMSAKKRKGILDRAVGYIKIAVDFDIPDAEVNRRLKDREEKTGKHIPQHVMKSMYASYQPPSRAEGFDQIIRIKS